MAEAVILEAVRTPFGRRGVASRNLRSDKLLTISSASEILSSIR